MSLSSFLGLLGPFIGIVRSLPQLMGLQIDYLEKKYDLNFRLA